MDLMAVSVRSRDEYEDASANASLAPKKTILATIHLHMFLCAGRRNGNKVYIVRRPADASAPSVRILVGTRDRHHIILVLQYNLVICVIFELFRSDHLHKHERAYRP